MNSGNSAFLLCLNPGILLAPALRMIKTLWFPPPSYRLPAKCGIGFITLWDCWWRWLRQGWLFVSCDFPAMQVVGYIKKFFKKLFSDMSWNNITSVGLLKVIGNWRMRDRGLGLASVVVEMCWNDNVRIAANRTQCYHCLWPQKLNTALK